MNFEPGDRWERDDAFELRLDEALAKSPAVVVPADFAARLAGMVPERPPVRLRETRYARNSVILCASMLLAGLLLLAPRVVPAGFNFALGAEWILCGLLSLLAIYSVSPWGPWRLRG